MGGVICTKKSKPSTRKLKLRIIGGALKGRKLISVPGHHTRPTSDRIREAIFNILGSRVHGAMVLDLFAGTGALGIESISRGAERVLFIDTHKRAISVLQRNIDAFSLEKKTTVIQWNILKNLDCIPSIIHTVDLVFMDPPYNKHLIEPSLFNLHRSGCLASGARLIVEHSQLEAMPQSDLPFGLIDQRQYGKTLVSFLDYML